MSGKRLAVNVVGFQLAWFALVLGAASGRDFLALAFAALVVVVHLAVSSMPLREAQLLIAVTVLGAAWESVPLALGWIDYRGAAPLAGFPPYWLAALWLVFATTLNGALRWFQPRLLLAAGVGAVVGPLCYLAGERLGAVAFVERASGVGAQAVAWAVLLPAALAIAARFDAAGEPVREGARV